jgi:hypothetical protein
MRYDGAVKLREAYAELEVDLGASREVVNQARKILLRVWHPDRHQSDAKLKAAAERKTARINEAYALIEEAGFPVADRFTEADRDASAPQFTLDQQIKLRELEIREREVAAQEKLAAKKSATEWLDQKAQVAKQGVSTLATVVLWMLIVLVGAGALAGIIEALTGSKSNW